MKRIKLFIISSIVLSLLCSCTSASNKSSETVAPSDTTPLAASTPSHQYNIPDEESLTQTYTSQVAKLTDSTIVSVEYESFEQDDLSSTVDIVAKMSDGRNLNICAMYTKNWNIVTISNKENSHFYYIPDNYKGTSELYDYNTDKIISKDSYNKRIKLEKATFNAPSSWNIEEGTDKCSITYGSEAPTYINILVNKNPNISLDKAWNILKKTFNNYSQIDSKSISIDKKKGKQWHFTFESKDGTTYESIYCIVKNGKNIYIFSIMQMWTLTNDSVFDEIIKSVKWKK